jgi:hypothetical protein
VSKTGNICKRCGKDNYSEPFDETFIETNEYQSLWPVSDSVVRNPFYEQNPKYTVKQKRLCKTRGCGMTLIEMAIRNGFYAAKGVQS